MRYVIQSKILKGEDEKNRRQVSNSSSIFFSDKELTILELKDMVKEFQGPLPQNTVVLEEKFYVGNKEMKDNGEILKKFNGLEYNLIIK
jgi:hypothetical protein